VLNCNVPVGWSNLPGEPLLNITELKENEAYTYAFFNVSWQAPSYFGGLDNVMYKITGKDDLYQKINSTTTNTHFPVHTALDFYNSLSIKVSVVTVQDNNSQYVPSNHMYTDKKFSDDDLFEAAIGKKSSANHYTFKLLLINQFSLLIASM